MAKRGGFPGGGIPGIAPMPADYEEQEDNADEE